MTTATITLRDEQISNEVTRCLIPHWVFMMRDIQEETGWRIGEVVSIRYENINWLDGTIHIVRAKESKSAKAKAPGKAVNAIKLARITKAKEHGNADDFMRWSLATNDEILSSITNAELRLLQSMERQAKEYCSKKTISKKLLGRLSDMQDMAADKSGWVFCRSLTKSNRTSGRSGSHITRSTAWARLGQLEDLGRDVGEMADETLFEAGKL